MFEDIKMHKILVVGAGSIGERHIRCLQNTKRAVVGICEINDDLRKKVSSAHDISKSFSNLEDALESEWDVGIIATPTDSHIPIAQKLADAGINLLIEKPLSTNDQGIDRLNKTVKDNKLIAAVAYVYRAHPAIQVIRDVIQGARFGKPLQLIAVCGQHLPFYRPAYREIFYADRQKGGGAIQDALTHIINAGEWLVGPIDRLAADAQHQMLEGVTVEDTVNLICRHGEVMGSYSLNQYQMPNEVTITIVCENGTIRFELHESCWRWMNQPEGDWHIEETPLSDRDDWFIRQKNAFLDAVEGKAEPLCTIQEASQTLKVNLAALKSVDSDSKWVDVSS